MSKPTAFLSHSKFYAEEHFRYGLARSGEFSSKQALLLENHGKAYQALHDGFQEPADDEERNFLAVCRGEREPSTPHEIAWVRFCQKTSMRPSISVFGVGHPSVPADDNSFASDDWD